MDRADAFFVQVDAVRIDVCDGRRGLFLGQLIRGSGRRWQADVRLRKRLGVVLLIEPEGDSQIIPAGEEGVVSNRSATAGGKRGGEGEA